MKIYAIRYTAAAQQSIEDQVDYLCQISDTVTAMTWWRTSRDAFKRKLTQYPKIYRRSELAAELGVMHYQELDTEDGYRIFFEILESKKIVVVHLVLRQRQSVENALIRYSLLK